MKLARKNSLLIKIGYAIYVIALLVLSIFVFGVGLTWFLQTLGLSPTISGTLSSQMSIVIYGLLLFHFDKENILNVLKNKLSFKILWDGVKITIIVLIINVIISTLLMQSSGLPEQTKSVIEKNSFLMTFFLPVIVAPLAEELTFRAGFKFMLIDKAECKPVSYIILSSLIFGFLHWSPGITGLAHMLLTGLIGITYNIIYLKTDNIYISIISHMLYNGLVITVASFLV